MIILIIQKNMLETLYDGFYLLIYQFISSHLSLPTVQKTYGG